MCSTIGSQEGKDPFKTLGKICLFSKGERGFRYREKTGHSKYKDVLFPSLHLAVHEGKDLPDLRKRLSA